MDVQARLEQLATMNAIGEILNQEPDFEDAINRSLKELVDLLGLTTGWVFLTTVDEGDSHQGGFYVAAKTGLPPALADDDGAALSEGACECQWRFRRGKLDRGVNIVHCSRLEAARGDKNGLEIHASMPLLGSSGPVGILNLAAPGPSQFRTETLDFLTAIGRQLGTAFERSRLLRARTREAKYTAALEERQRLATEMHDSVAQLLFAADLGLRTAKESTDPKVRQGSLEKSAALVEEALTSLQALVEVLRPADVSAGLHAALARLASRTTGPTGVHFEAEPFEVSDEITSGLYRVAQEAVHNALKHAGADNVWIRLARRGDQVRLIIEDDGTGFAPEQEAGVGIGSMRKRASALGGHLALSRTLSGGLRVEAVVPWTSYGRIQTEP